MQAGTGKRYVLLGAGRQGIAAAFDLAKFGNADRIVIVDADKAAAETAVARLRHHFDRPRRPAFVTRALDCSDRAAVAMLLDGEKPHVVISAMHYELNEMLTAVAIATGTSMVDLGGNTAVVRRQHGGDRLARAAKVVCVPDCGMEPGFAANMVVNVAERFDEVHSLAILCGGLTPEDPGPPFFYKPLFSYKGLANEYRGMTTVILGGKLETIVCVGRIGSVVIPPLGKLEKAVTAGGLSTMPYTLLGRFAGLQKLTTHTLRYPGHWQLVKGLRKSGRFDDELPRLFEAAARSSSDPRDVGVIRVIGRGMKDGKRKKIVYDVIDQYDPVTGLTSMQRLTGFHASVVAIMAAHAKIDPSVVPVEHLDSGYILTEMGRRGINVHEH